MWSSRSLVPPCWYATSTPVGTSTKSDIARLYNFLLGKDVSAANRAVLAIREAFLPLKQTPVIGRPVKDHPYLRELIVDFGASSYLALYRSEPANGAVVILAIKDQREDDYK